MRIPAVAIAAEFTVGILLGRELHFPRGAFGISFLVVFSLLIAASLFAWRKKLWVAAFFPLIGWVRLGAIGMVVASWILRTDEVGAGQVVTDGHGIRVRCFVGCGEDEEERRKIMQRR
jgi:hypothetical protein